MNVAIIGAGATGMAAAWDLVRAGHAVTIFEAADRVGGLAAGFKDEGWAWELEKFYHHWFQSDHDILTLIAELGLSANVVFPRPKTSMWSKGKPYLFDNPLSMLLFPNLPWLPKIRFGLVGLYLRLSKAWQGMERSTAEDWLIRAMGRTAYDALWKPMLIGKFGEVYREVTMAWFWARIHTRTVRLGSYVGGFQRFLDDFAGKLEQQGVTLRMNTPVKGIQQHDGRSNVTTAVGSHSFDAAISTTSPAAMLKLAPDLPTTYAERLRNLRHMGAAVVVLALDRQFMTDGTYWLNLPASSPDKANSEFPFLALVEHTNYLDRVNYGGDHVLYMGDYIVPDHEYLTMSEDALVDRFIDALPRLRPDFKRDWIRKQWVFRTSYAQPIPFVNHSQHIPDLYTGVPGLYLASMSQVYPWDRGTNYAVQIGREVARRVMADATSRHGKITETRTR